MNAAARLKAVEQALAKLASQRGPRVSELLRRAREEAIAGKVGPDLHDVAELERVAQGRGILAEIARGQLRVIRAPGPGALLPPARAGKDERGEPAGADAPVSAPTRSPGTAGVAQIDQVLARYV